MKRVLTEEEIPQDVIDKAERWHDKRKDFDPGAHAARGEDGLGDPLPRALDGRFLGH